VQGNGFSSSGGRNSSNSDGFGVGGRPWQLALFY
jgi:hypothetical protein